MSASGAAPVNRALRPCHSPRMRPYAALALFLASAAPDPARAQVYVDDDAAPGGDGSMGRPLQRLQDGIDRARDGDDVYVAGGTYAPFAIDARVLRLHGGYDADFAAPSDATPSVVEGSPDAPVVRLYETGATLVEGFTIRGGSQGVIIDADYLSTTNTPEIRGCVIEDNHSAERGGGISATHCDARIVGNVIRGNTTSGDARGAGIASDCRTLLVEGNTIEGNRGGGDHGGGLFLAGGTFTVRRNRIANNVAATSFDYGYAGGAVVANTGTLAVFEQNEWTGNSAPSNASALMIDDGARATVDHDLFWDNVCPSAYGTAIWVNGGLGDSSASLTNVTVAGHDCAGLPQIAVDEASTLEVVSSIVWDGGGADFLADDTSTLTVRYTLTEAGMAGEGNVSGDPLFADAAAGDFHVRSTRGRFLAGAWVTDDADSPTIDVGDPAADFAAEPGPNGLRINLGHTGGTAEASMGGPGGDPPSADAGPGRSDAGLARDGGGSVPSDGGAAPGGPEGCGCRAADPSTRSLAPALACLAFALTRRRAPLAQDRKRR